MNREDGPLGITQTIRNKGNGNKLFKRFKEGGYPLEKMLTEKAENSMCLEPFILSKQRENEKFK